MLGNFAISELISFFRSDLVGSDIDNFRYDIIGSDTNNITYDLVGSDINDIRSNLISDIIDISSIRALSWARIVARECVY